MVYAATALIKVTFNGRKCVIKSLDQIFDHVILWPMSSSSPEFNFPFFSQAFIGTVFWNRQDKPILFGTRVNGRIANVLSIQSHSYINLLFGIRKRHRKLTSIFELSCVCRDNLFSQIHAYNVLWMILTFISDEIYVIVCKTYQVRLCTLK